MSSRSLVPWLALLAISFCAVVVDAAPRSQPARNCDPLGPLAARGSWQPAFSGTRAWQELRPQMTKDDVLKILGAPPWTDCTLLFEFWMYEVGSTLASGVVVFENERVFSWRPPSLAE